jgi:O-antigen ligase
MAEHPLTMTEGLQAVWYLFFLPLLTVALYLNLLTPVVALMVLVASAAIAAVLRLRRENHLILLDVGFLLYVVSVGISCWHSVYAPNSMFDLVRVTVGFLLYASLRSYEPEGIDALYLCLSLFGAGSALYALVNWFHGFVLIKQAGFTGLLPFRRNLSWGGADGYSGNEALRFLIFIGLGLLCAVIASRKRSWMWGAGFTCLLLNTACLLLTLSRLVYVALIASSAALLASLLWNRLRLPRSGIAIVAGIAVAMVLLVTSLGLGRDVVDVLSMATTPGQLRSISGRARITSHSWDLLRQHWRWGIGAGNYGYQSCIETGIDSGCAPEAFNWFIQAVLEQGILGLLSVSILWGGIFRACISRPQTKSAVLWSVCASSASFAMLVFNLGQSAMFFNPHLIALCAVWFAVLATGVESRTRCDVPYAIS